MKKIILFLSFGIMLLGCQLQSTLRAQVPMAIPNGSFEQWTSHSGYSVTVLIFPISVYGSYSTPSAWNYPSYPVNESVSLMGMNVNINTTVPLVKASQETGDVPDSNTAVKLQSFMLSDIVSSTVLNVAGGYIDTSLTQQVIPSILLTGTINIDAFIPLLSDLMSGTGDINTLLPTLLAEDVNDYITGGLPLGDFRPGMLTGSYKYHSAVGGDNGGVVMLGTRYNTVTHQRDVVGAGFNIGLVDTGVYTPFEVEYFPLREFVPGSPNLDPDTLIIALVSSASTSMQQGSYLCLDNLMLWSAPDTCADITSLVALPQIHEAVLGWSISDLADSFEIEYGPTGFALGSGTTVITTSTMLNINGLDASTVYDAYVRTLCSDTTYGDWSGVQFATLNDTCASIMVLAAAPQIHEAVLSWSASGPVESFEIEYGPTGFALGTGTTATTAMSTITLGGLLASTSYDFYIRTLCSNTIYGPWSGVQFVTLADTCATVLNLAIESNAHDAFPEMVLTWDGSSEPEYWEVEYGPQGFQLGEGVRVTMTARSFEIYPLEANGSLQPNTWYDFYVRSVCAEYEGTHHIWNGTWDSVHYLTHCAKVVSPTVNGDNTAVTADNLISGYSIGWTDNTDTRSWAVYYGIYNEQMPDNWGTYVEVDTPYFAFPPLIPDRTYSVEVSARCGEDNYGDIVLVNFTTPELTGIERADAVTLTVSPNPAHGQCEVNVADGQPARLELYGLDGRLLQTLDSNGQPVTLQLPSTGVFLLHATTTAGTTTYKIVNQ